MQKRLALQNGICFIQIFTKVNLTTVQLCGIMLQPNHTFFSEITNKMFIKVFDKIRIKYRHYVTLGYSEID